MGTALIIDDSSTEREILTGCLKQAGYTILTATSGEEALDKLVLNGLKGLTIKG